MKQYNTRATIAPDLANMNQYAQNAQLTSILSGLAKGFGGAMSFKQNQAKAGTFVKEIKDRQDILYKYLQDPNIDPATKRAYEQEWGRLTVMGNQANIDPTSIDDILKTYYGGYDKIADPMSLANALQVAQIGANARIAAANALAGSKPTINIGGEPIASSGNTATPGIPPTLQEILRKMNLQGSGMNFRNAPNAMGIMNEIMSLTGTGG